MPADFSSLMREAQNLKARMEKMQEELASLEVTGEAGGGLVKVTVNGHYETRHVSIDPVAMDDREMLEDLVAAAGNDAVRRVRQAVQERFSGLAGLPPGLLPGL